MIVRTEGKGRRRVVGAMWACVVAGLAGRVGAAVTVADLGGKWEFALDPLGRGEEVGWHRPAAGWDGGKAHGAGGWDGVEVPHTYSLDPRFDYTGKAWYRRSVKVGRVEPGMRYRLAFEAVYYKCRVWVNGEFAGAHEGGYTPFTVDVTRALRGGRFNLICVEVDNAWSQETLPGARPGAAPNAQLFPWWNYGGIIRPVRLEATGEVFVEGQKVEARPPGRAGEAARVKVVARVRNAGGEVARKKVAVEIRGDGGKVVARAESAEVEVAAGGVGEVVVEAEVAGGDVRVWELGAPALYTSVAGVAGAGEAGASSTTFGIRSIEVRDAKLLLNGRAVRLAGGNRVADHPMFGSIEPDDVVKKDLGMMAGAHLRLARLQHQPVARGVLEWADRNGMLVIAECANWGFPAAHMESAVIREKFRGQMREMVEEQWNHPSVIGWSVGNEYESWTAEGMRWTRDMGGFVRSMDGTRPVTFVALGAQGRRVAEAVKGGGGGGPLGFEDCDVLCLNTYGSVGETGEWLDAMHAMWPGKPILVTEYGKRADKVADEGERVRHFEEMLGVVRRREFVCGLSYWSFNDYRSRYPGTDASGYRPWGLVTAAREPRALLGAMRRELMPVVVEAVEAAEDGKSVAVTLRGRGDFPAVSLRELRVVATRGEGDAAGAEVRVGAIEPGERVRVSVPVDGGGATGGWGVRVIGADGVVVGECGPTK